MPTNRINFSKWVERFNNGDFDDPGVRVQIEAGWYDWFCRDTSLVNKTKIIGNIVKRIKPGGKVNLEEWYIWFKNNCPLHGPLYDDFRFARLDTGAVMFTTQIDCLWNDYKYAVYGRTPDGVFQREPLFEADNLRRLVEWFNKPWYVRRQKL